jgi:hypothetical protein
MVSVAAYWWRFRETDRQSEREREREDRERRERGGEKEIERHTHREDRVRLAGASRVICTFPFSTWPHTLTANGIPSPSSTVTCHTIAEVRLVENPTVHAGLALPDMEQEVPF